MRQVLWQQLVRLELGEEVRRFDAIVDNSKCEVDSIGRDLTRSLQRALRRRREVATDKH